MINLIKNNHLIFFFVQDFFKFECSYSHSRFGLGNYLHYSQVEYLFLYYLVLIFSLKTLQRISNSALKILYVSSPVSIQHYKKQNGQKNTTPITVNILKLKTALSLSPILQYVPIQFLMYYSKHWELYAFASDFWQNKILSCITNTLLYLIKKIILQNKLFRKYILKFFLSIVFFCEIYIYIHSVQWINHCISLRLCIFSSFRKFTIVATPNATYNIAWSQSIWRVLSP